MAGNKPDSNNYNPDSSKRELQSSVKDTNLVVHTVGIKDIDEAIFYYFNEVLKPSVIQNGNRINVPLVYGSPER